MGRARGQQQAVTATPGRRDGTEPAAFEVYREGPVAADDLPEFTNILIEFPRSLTPAEREDARGILAYWAYQPQHCNGSEENRWLTDRHLWIDASSHNTRSSNWRQRDIFGELEKMFLEGTPARVRQNNTRKWRGLGMRPQRVVLSHPGDSGDLDAGPLDFSPPQTTAVRSPVDLLRTIG